jgi:GNAT superfamily N-acetyltransferase
MELRSARAGEAETLLAIQRSSALAAFAHVFPPDRYTFPADVVREHWKRALDDRATEVLLAEQDGDAVGLAAFSRGWLRSLFVVPAAQRMGIGSGLLDQALVRLREAGDTRCRLWTLEENQKARGFYERRGWRLDGRMRIVPFPPYPLDVGYRIEL